MDVNCGGGGGDGGAGGGGSSTAKNVGHIKGRTGSINSLDRHAHETSRRNSLQLRENMSGSGKNTVLAPKNSNGILNDNDAAISPSGNNSSRASVSSPPARARVGSFEKGLNGLGFVGRSSSLVVLRPGPDPTGPSDSYVLQICDTRLTITDAGPGLSTQEMACLLNPYGTIRPESHDVDEQGTVRHYYSDKNNSDDSQTVLQ